MAGKQAKQNVGEYWEIRRGKEVICSSTIPFLGYSSQVLLSMYESGYCCYRNGNRVKKCDLTSV